MGERITFIYAGTIELWTEIHTQWVWRFSGDMIMQSTHFHTFQLYLVGEMSELPCCAFDLKQIFWSIGISGAIHHTPKEVAIKGSPQLAPNAGKISLDLNTHSVGVTR